MAAFMPGASPPLVINPKVLIAFTLRKCRRRGSTLIVFFFAAIAAN
jgi:hypothetical protein